MKTIKKQSNINSTLKSIIYLSISIMFFLSFKYSEAQTYLTNGQQVPVYNPGETDSTSRYIYWDLTEINNSNSRLDLGAGVTHYDGSDNFINGNWYKNENNVNLNNEVTNNRFIFTVNDSKIINGFLFILNDSTGRKDAVVTRGNGEMQIYNNNNGTIGSLIQSLDVYGSILYSGQFSTDSHEDAVVLSNSGDTVKIYNGIGNGRFETTPYNYYGIHPEKLALAQLSSYCNPYSIVNNTTGDREELIYREDEYIKILKNSNSNYFTPWITIDTDFESDTIHDFKVADFNNDGFNDIVVVNNKDGIKIYVNNNGESFSLGYENLDYPNFHTYSVSTGDFNKDGFEDLAILTTIKINIYLNNKTDSLFSATPSSVFYFEFPLPFKAFPMKSKIADLYNKGGLAVLFSATFDNFSQNYEIENLFRINASDTDAVPAPPLLFKDLVLVGQHYRPRLHLFNRGERDFQKYIIYKKSPNFNNNNWFLYDSSNTSGVYVDDAESFNEGGGGPRPPDNLFYYVKAQDNSYQISINSDTIGYSTIVCPGCGWEAEDNFTVTNIQSNETPKEYSVKNYPNPFNPVTQIFFNIPVEGNVKLTVFNTAGQKVSELINEYKSPGSYKIDFNGNNLASGIYYYRIEAGSFSQVRKMILLK